MNIQTSTTGLIAHFVNTFELDEIEVFDQGGQSIAFELTAPDGVVLHAGVPEPATALLLGLGWVGLAAARTSSR